MMKIYDKASWQIDNGIDRNVVIGHFAFVFNWLQKCGMLNENGLEILDIGIGQDASLNNSLVTEEGAKFLNQFYDELVKHSEYDISLEEKLLHSYFEEFTTSSKE